jgi:hypothetical protein
MNLKTRIAHAALAVFAAAAIVPVAQATQPNGGATVRGNHHPVANYSSHLLDLTAMGDRYQAQAKRLSSAPSWSSSHLQDLTAMGVSYQAQAKLSPVDPAVIARHGALGRLPIPSAANGQQARARTSGGFDWGDASIGAGSAFVFSLLLAVGMLIAVNVRHRRQNSLSPTGGIS